jgi:WD40 repeat protein
MASGDTQNFINIWNITAGLVLNSLLGHASKICSLAKLKNNLLASGSHDSTVKIWNYLNGKLIKTLAAHSNAVYGLCMINGGNQSHLMSASLDGTVKLWKLDRIHGLANTSSLPEYGK